MGRLAGKAVERQTKTSKILRLYLQCNSRRCRNQVRLQLSSEGIDLCSMSSPCDPDAAWRPQEPWTCFHQHLCCKHFCVGIILILLVGLEAARRPSSNGQSFGTAV